MRFYNRVGHVELISGNGGLLRSYDGLDFRFHVKKTIGGISDKATVGILGLNNDSISYFSTFTDNAHQLQKNWRVRVYAGYKEEGEHLIIDGDLIRAVPSIPPENWINMSVMCNAYRNSNMLSISTSAPTKYWWGNNPVSNKMFGIRIKDILDKFVKYAGYDGWKFDPAPYAWSMQLDNELEHRVKSFDCSGTQNDIIQELNLLGDFYVHVEGNTLIVSPPTYGDGDIPNTRQRLNAKRTLARGDDKFSRFRYISEGNGLVGIPQYKYPYCTMTTRITSGIKIFDVVELKCRYNVQANGKYKIYEITYDGHLRGDAWYARLNARSLMAPLSDEEKKQIEEDKKKKK